MAILFPLITGVIAIPTLLYGAEMIVHHAKTIAKSMGIHDFFIGLTILSIGTSFPEIFTHIVAATKIIFDPTLSETLAGIAIGTDIGSNIVQITLITGIVGIYGKLKASKEFMNFDYRFMLLGILMLWFFMFTESTLTRLEGIILIGSYGWYLYKLTKDEKIINIKVKKKTHLLWHSFYITIGLILLLFSAKFILDSATFFAEYFNVSGSLIGTLVIGVCTALPELTTSLVAIKNKAGGLSLGTLIGSNITNPLLGIGLGATIATYPIESTIINLDMSFWFIASTLCYFLLLDGLSLSKKQATIMAGAYLIYIVLRLLN